MATYNYKNYNQDSFAKFLDEIGEVGYVESLEVPIVSVSGLPGATLKEVVLFEHGSLGQVISLHEYTAKVMLLSQKCPSIKERAVRTNMELELAVGESVLGKIIDSLGNDLYGKIDLESYEDKKQYRKIDSEPPGIDKRVKINQFFETGVAIVDTLIPLGKGQRELIIGNRKTGKTEFLLQTMLNQAKQGTICVYACIGKPILDVKKVEKFINDHKIQQSCVIVASFATDPSTMVYLTPMAAMTLSEYFVETGRDVLLILDDMTDHAKYYREFALIAGNFPGRSAYPADIFYTHSKLLERAGYFKTEKGINSLTCLPVAETIQGDLTGYIQTNLMSITDGHIFFDEDLFVQGIRPAINYSLSVTRVGRQTQTKLKWSIARELTSFLTQLEKTQSFIHFGAEVNQAIRSTLAMGEKIIYGLFSQDSDYVIESNLQILLFALIWSQILQTKNIDELKTQCKKIAERYHKEETYKNLVDEMINSCDNLNKLLGLVSSKHMELI